MVSRLRVLNSALHALLLTKSYKAHQRSQTIYDNLYTPIKGISLCGRCDLPISKISNLTHSVRATRQTTSSFQSTNMVQVCESSLRWDRRYTKRWSMMSMQLLRGLRDLQDLPHLQRPKTDQDGPRGIKIE